MRSNKLWTIACGALLACAAMQAFAQQESTPQIPVFNFRSPEDTRKFGRQPDEIKPGMRPDYRRLREQLVTIPVRDRVHLIAGAGANITVLAGDQGVMLVDAGVESASDKVIASYKAMTPEPLKWLLNTSADLDHTGGNAPVGGSGAGPGNLRGGGGIIPGGAGGTANIVAHDGVYRRMSTTAGTTPARPTAAWPTSAFFTARKTLHFNGEPIEILHQPSAYTDGDVLVWFRKSDVIAAGDVLTTDFFPRFDSARGGSLQGLIDALNQLVYISVPEFNSQGGTLIVPGHGRIANQSDVAEIRDMLTIVRDRVKEMVSKRMTLAQIKTTPVLLDFEQIYGTTEGEWTTDMFLEAVVNDLSRRPASPTTR